MTGWPSAGLAYGPAFRGLRAAWRRAGEVFAEVSLDEAAGSQGGRFGLHPAVLDASLHAIGLCDDAEVEPGLPFAWSGVELHATGATKLRVWVRPAGGGAVSIVLADQAGQPVASVESLVLRAVPGTLPIAATARQESMFGWEWSPAEVGLAPMAAGRWAVVGADGQGIAAALRAAGLTPEVTADLAALAWPGPDGGTAPDVAVIDRTARAVSAASATDLPAMVYATTAEMLALLQEWLSAAAVTTRLLVVTHGAMALPGEDVTDLAGAAAWGMVRSAQAEHPGRFVLADLDGRADSLGVLPALVASGEPQAVVRKGAVHVGRLVRPRADDGQPASVFGPEGTTLITGATGVVGRLITRHLVAERGVRRLLLLSRGGAAPDLVEELTTLGAAVSVAACDVSERDDLARVLRAIPAEYPLTAVVHLAGVLDDGVISALSPERVGAVLRPKAGGAWHLHELTKDHDLTAFVLFSSASGLLGNGGQGNYAAANTFLDGLAAHRRAHGLPAQSFAWGVWSAIGKRPSALTDDGLAQLARSGIAALSDAEGLELFDAATARPDALLAPMKIEPTGPGGFADLPHEFRLLVPAVRRSAARAAQPDVAALRQRLAGLPAEQQDKALQELVLGRAAALLGYDDAKAIDPHRHFLESGFNSLTAVELRNSLNAATGLRLPATVIFDHQTPARLAGHLRDELGAAGSPGATQASQMSADPVADALKQLFAEALHAGKVQDGVAILGSAANLRPSFESAADLGEMLVPVRLTEGAQRPRLICLAAPVAAGGVYQYARLASYFRGVRDLSALPMPGFLAGERLPASAGAVVEVLTESVRKAVGSEPFALLGYSSAGIFAHAAAGCLERLGNPPAAVILLDTYAVGATHVVQGDQGDREQVIVDMAVGMLERESQYGTFDRTKLTAMARYMTLLPDVSVTDITAPAMLLQPEDRFSFAADGGRPADESPGGWQTTWDRADTIRTVPGDHFSLVEGSSETTARVIEDWLESLS